MTLRMIDTFSGIGGFSLAARWLGGFQTVQFVEWNPYCQQILAHQFPDIPIHDDITTFNPQPYSADVVCGGFPCQDISTAGKQAGIKEGTRSGLFYELMRVIRLVRPRYVVLENVSAIISNGLDAVLGELAEAGLDAEWACIPASAVGACHQRDRWWLVAYPTGTGAGQHESHTRRQRDGESLPTDRCADQEISQHFAYTQGQRCVEGPGRGTQQAGRQSPRAGDGAARSDAPVANDQRQQEHNLATVADRAGRASWRHAARSLNPDWRGYVSQPVLPRGDDGLSHRVDRIHALGNAVVPQVAMIPLQRVLDLHHAER
jgi:DNA (cytosine-5)-methyltransferase 1